MTSGFADHVAGVAVKALTTQGAPPALQSGRSFRILKEELES
jgi:hypothetical protein